jgi:UDPglucose--hexose-1-phosphate uridylyltransferase
MPELRKDPIVGRWVIISTERGKRPSEFEFSQPPLKVGFCPFCPGNENKTPSEILAYRKNGGVPNSSGWHIRVVPNKYPALKVEGELNREGDGVYDKMNGIGAHEVIIESPNHKETLSNILPRQFEEVLWAFRDRIIDLKKDNEAALHTHLQEPRRGRRRHSRTHPLAAYRPSDHPQEGRRGIGRRP